MRACRRAGLAVPEVLVDDDGARLGTAGLVMAHVSGETLARRILRDDEFATTREHLVDDLGRFLAGLHAIDPAEVPGALDTDSVTQSWAAYEQLDDVSPTFEKSYEWLRANRPRAHRDDDRARRPAARERDRRRARARGRDRLGARPRRRSARGPRVVVRQGVAVRRAARGGRRRHDRPTRRRLRTGGRSHGRPRRAALVAGRRRPCSGASAAWVRRGRTSRARSVPTSWPRSVGGSPNRSGT